VVRALAHRLFSKFVASVVNGWIFAGTAIAAEIDVTEASHRFVDPKTVIAILLVGAVIMLARRGADRAAS
jgi:hypothetical protein